MKVVQKHVYLNGELQATTTTPRANVIQQMVEQYGATLFRECLITIPKNQDRYLKMRFTAPADVIAARLAETRPRQALSAAPPPEAPADTSSATRTGRERQTPPQASTPGRPGEGRQRFQAAARERFQRSRGR